MFCDCAASSAGGGRVRGPSRRLPAVFRRGGAGGGSVLHPRLDARRSPASGQGGNALHMVAWPVFRVLCSHTPHVCLQIPSLPVSPITPWTAPQNYLKKEQSIVGDDSHIGDKVLMKNCSIGNHCRIGERCKINNCIIMNNVQIGDNCVLQNCVISHNCVLEDNCSLNDCQLAPDARVVAGRTFPASHAMLLGLFHLRSSRCLHYGPQRSSRQRQSPGRTNAQARVRWRRFRFLFWR